MNQRHHGAPGSPGARGASEASTETSTPASTASRDPWVVALAAIRAEREEALATLATIEQAVIKARTLPRAEAVRIIDAAGSLEHELGLADPDCACDVLLEQAFPDLHDPQGEVIDLDDARRILGGTP
jgi:hypothetical protein